MKVAPITAAVTAAIAIGSVATPVLAQGYGYYTDQARYDSYACGSVKHQDQTSGGILGAIAGAVLGSNIAHGGGRTGGALIGAAAGAVVGSNIGISASRGSDACQAAAGDGYYGPARYERGYVYQQPAYYGGGSYYQADYYRSYPHDAHDRWAHAQGGDDHRDGRGGRDQGGYRGY